LLCYGCGKAQHEIHRERRGAVPEQVPVLLVARLALGRTDVDSLHRRRPKAEWGNAIEEFEAREMMGIDDQGEVAEA
jgi:hypothetical protein